MTGQSTTSNWANSSRQALTQHRALCVGQDPVAMAEYRTEASLGRRDSGPRHPTARPRRERVRSFPPGTFAPNTDSSMRTYSRAACVWSGSSGLSR